VRRAPSSSAYAVRPAVALEELAGASDVVCKATVVADRPVADAWFPAQAGFEVRETELRVVSVIKGAKAKRLLFHHYARKAGGIVPVCSIWLLFRTLPRCAGFGKASRRAGEQASRRAGEQASRRAGEQASRRAG